MATMVWTMPPPQQSTPRYTPTGKYIGYTEIVANSRKLPRAPSKLHTTAKPSAITKDTILPGSTGTSYSHSHSHNNKSKHVPNTANKNRVKSRPSTKSKKRPVRRPSTPSFATPVKRKRPIPTMVLIKTVTPPSYANKSATPSIRNGAIHYKNYTKIVFKLPQSTTTTTTRKPVVVIRKGSKRPSLTKQVYNIPTPNPRPEISSYSPEYPISNEIPSVFNDYATQDIVLPNANEPLSPEISGHSPPYSIGSVLGNLPSSSSSSTETSLLSSPVSNLITNPLNAIQLSIRPDAIGDGTGLANCPTVELSGAMLSNLPLNKQGCPDLNFVINSYLQQNTIPQGEAVDDGIVVDAADASEVESSAVAPLAEEASPVADAVPAATASDPVTGGIGGTGGTGGTGGAGDSGGIGFPSLPGFPEFPELPSLSSLRGLFNFFRIVWRLLSTLFGFLRNPFLWMLPSSLMFGSGLLVLMSMFPFWMPLLYFTTSRNSDAVHYTHHHPPVHHYNGWYWDKKTKSWHNVLEQLKGRQRRAVDFGDFNDPYVSWKSRRKKR